MKKLSSSCLAVLMSLAVFSGSAVAGAAKAKTPTLSKFWQSKAVLKVPESVLFDAERKVLYASNVDGKNPWANDGAGSIAKLDLNGRVISAEWVTGLNAPKGMGVLGGALYVTDNDKIVTIDIKKGVIVDRFSVPGATYLNDLSVADNGTIYFTDSKKGDIYSLINGKLSKLIQGLEGLNGVLHSDGELLFLSDKSLFSMNADGKYVAIASGFEDGGDGVERVSKNAWLVSTWSGLVYYVTRSGEITELLDGRPQKVNAADLGYDPVNKIAYFPAFWNNYVAAYKLEL